MLKTVREQAAGLTKDQRNAFVAASLGWAMDAFDYFLVVLVYSEIADDFHVSLTDMAFLTTATMVMRPVGALIFGLWADRKGRRYGDAGAEHRGGGPGVVPAARAGGSRS
ncbi:hypothetical protein [Streptomyces sp. NPDC101455]|uniref:hypothetical protein n=1 Tax=Streptomyces sp. NPDC101455 TaxID=3366142 RepID=UPI00380693BA